MSAGIEWTEQALKDLARLDHRMRRRIFDAAERLVKTGYGDIKKLQGLDEDLYRLRVGQWRVIFSRKTNGTAVVRRVRSRGSAYRP